MYWLVLAEKLVEKGSMKMATSSLTSQSPAQKSHFDTCQQLLCCRHQFYPYLFMVDDDFFLVEVQLAEFCYAKQLQTCCL